MRTAVSLRTYLSSNIEEARMLDRFETIEAIRKMLDIDGYAEGDCISRQGVIGVLQGLPDSVDPAYEDDLK